MSSEKIITDVENYLPSWISDHLGVYHAMDPYVKEDLASTSVRSNPPQEGTTQPIDDPQPIRDEIPLLKKKTNIMTQEELGHSRESCLFPTGIQMRLPAVGETIALAFSSKVAFYVTGYLVGLRFPFHFYNIYLA
ncbi:hypothetical protein Acr_00g0054870 [Actinidia rufa]|uniref:Uncharacterized protein n=1 Tax=Actinidia rufa TaxID=165716 RepID=A0A7J0DLY8_9ERIC|nr:hypothetical protein Acr_00g0054870 [Actinidia rufa]